MKTIGELKSKDRERALYNAMKEDSEEKLVLDTYNGYLNKPLDAAFSWAESKQGHKYWSNLAWKN